MKDELILPYKLEQHLAEICNSNATYTNLLSVWNINKKICQDALSAVVMNYPHYTRHDVSHCEAIITNMEMLLGEENIKNLSPTDTWLLLHAAYLHDIGMVTECKRIEENWESKEFQDYLREAENSSDEGLAENAKFINSFVKNCEKEETVIAWPVRVRYAVTLVIADYYRRRHAEDSRQYMQDLGNAFHIDLGFNGLIQQRLIYLLADIAYLHTESSVKILELDYRTNGFNADYAHPRFLALMLRMGDLLDADNNRFNETNELVFGKIPKTSKNHWEKHMSARHILITPDIIEYTADCSSPEVYRETRVFLTWLKEEVEFWALNWKNIMPENIVGSAPKLGKCELLLKGVPDIQGLTDLRFSISPEKAFEVIEGANIYDDKFVFLREVIQNALDACKIQMWRDILENRYRSWIKAEDIKDMQPYEIDHNVFENYAVDVKMCSCDEENFEVIIADNGIGLSADQLKAVCDVGVSYAGDKKKKEEIESMPLWLRPTAGFGIGLQSIFLIADEFEIYSKASGTEGIYAKVTSRRRNGYVQITKSDKRKEQGTEIHVVLPKDINFSYGFLGNTAEYISREFDPFSKERNIAYYKIWDVLRETVENTFFPINIYFEDEKVDTVAAQPFDNLEKCSEDGRYQYKLLQGYEMEIWDKKTSTKMCATIKNTYDGYSSQFYFKGMDIKNAAVRPSKGIWYKIDFYGLDTKKSLSLDRKGIRKEEIKNVNKILQSAIAFYLEKIEDALLAKKQGRTEEELQCIYTYWCTMALKKKKEGLEKYKDIYENVQVNIDVLCKDEENKYSKKMIDFKEIVRDLEQVAVIYNLSEFKISKEMRDIVNVQLIAEILNKNPEDNYFKYVIVDDEFGDALSGGNENRIMVAEDGEDTLYLESYTTEENVLPDAANASTINYLMESLVKKQTEDSKYSFSNGEIRRGIVGLGRFSAICTTMVPFGIKLDYWCKSGNIICPFTTKQWEANKHLPKDEFVDLVCSGEEFENLVNHVAEHPYLKENNSKENIREEYRRFAGEVYKVGKGE